MTLEQAVSILQHELRAKTPDDVKIIRETLMAAWNSGYHEGWAEGVASRVDEEDYDDEYNRMMDRYGWE